MKFIKLFKSNQEITDVSPNMLVYKEEANSNYTYPYNKYYKLTKDGIFYGDLTSGETLTDYYINYRQSSATDEGKLSIQKIKGYTLGWNQLVNCSSTSLSGISKTDYSGYVIVNGTPSPSNHIYSTTLSLIANHNYLYMFRCSNFPKSVTSPNAGYQIHDFNNTGQSWSVADNSIKDGISTQIIKPTKSSSNVCVRIRLDSTITYVNTSFNKPMLIDLTLMFGAGKEPSTSNEFANRLGYESIEEVPYIPYQNVILKSYKYNEIQTSKFNLLNLQNRHIVNRIGSTGTNILGPFDEYGYFNSIGGDSVTYNNSSSSLTIKEGEIIFSGIGVWYGPGFIVKVKPNTTYYLKFDDINNNIRPLVKQFNACYTQLKYEYPKNTTFTTLNNCYYIVIIFQPSDANNLNIHAKNICLNISNTNQLKGPINGEYKPYEKHNISLEQIMTTHFPYGLLECSNAYDEIMPTKVVKKCSIYTFTGNESWGKDSNAWYISSLGGSLQGKVKCYLKQYGSPSGYSEDEIIWGYSGAGYFELASTQFTTETSVKNYLKNLYNNGNPLQIIIQNKNEEYFINTNLTIEDSWYSNEFISGYDENNIGAPLRCDCQYLYYRKKDNLELQATNI